MLSNFSHFRSSHLPNINQPGSSKLSPSPVSVSMTPTIVTIEAGSDAPEDEEWEDIDDGMESTDFEDDGGECGADEEDELGFGSL